MNLFRIASRLVARFAFSPSVSPQEDTYDTQMAITQILLRNGWEKTSRGTYIRKVKSKFQSSPKVYTLDTSSGKMMVKDQGGRIVSKVNLSDVRTNDQIYKAAKTLNEGAAKVV